MAERLRDEISRLIDEIPPDDADETERSFWRWMRLSGNVVEQPDYLPLVVSGFDPARPEEWAPIWPGHIRYDLGEQIIDPDKMLWELLVQMVPLRRFPNDSDLVVMPMFGNAFLLSALGLEVRVIDDCLEPARTLGRHDIRELELVDDLMEADLIRAAVEFLHYARDILPDHIHRGLCFMMSPYDLAYLIRGPELMLDMYEAPDVVHELMKLCTTLFLRATRLLKVAADEPPEFHRYFSGVFAGGGLLCEDCCVMLSPELHAEFSIPYTRQALEVLGGGWVHFCGDGSHLLENYLNVPKLYGIQYGQLDKNGSLKSIAAAFERAGKAFNCSMPRDEDEPWACYFERMLSLVTRRKSIYTHVSLYTDEPDTGEALLDLWHESQDRVLAN